MLRYYNNIVNHNYIRIYTFGEDSLSMPMMYLCKLSKTDSHYEKGDLIIGKIGCKYFDCKLWFDLGKNVRITTVSLKIKLGMF